MSERAPDRRRAPDVGAAGRHGRVRRGRPRRHLDGEDRRSGGDLPALPLPALSDQGRPLPRHGGPLLDRVRSTFRGTRPRAARERRPSRRWAPPTPASSPIVTCSGSSSTPTSPPRRAGTSAGPGAKTFAGSGPRRRPRRVPAGGSRPSSPGDAPQPGRRGGRLGPARRALGPRLSADPAERPYRPTDRAPSSRSLPRAHDARGREEDYGIQRHAPPPQAAARRGARRAGPW